MGKDRNNQSSKEFAQFFQEAEEKYLTREYGLPKPLDKSFMMEDRRPARKKGWKRAVAVIAGIILFLSGYSYGFIKSNSDQAFADKGLIQRVYESIMGVDTDEQDNNAVDSTSNLQITDQRDLDEAKDLIPDLYVPGYLPSGYDFVRLTIKKNSNGVGGKYEYWNGKQNLYITLTVTEDNESSYVSNDFGDLIELKDRLIYVYDDNDSITVLMDTCMLLIRGEMPQKEMIKIAKGLYRYRWD